MKRSVAAAGLSAALKEVFAMTGMDLAKAYYETYGKRMLE